VDPSRQLLNRSSCKFFLQCNGGHFLIIYKRINAGQADYWTFVGKGTTGQDRPE